MNRDWARCFGCVLWGLEMFWIVYLGISGPWRLNYDMRTIGMCAEDRMVRARMGGIKRADVRLSTLYSCPP
ncbi:hypothetical protein BDZ89DRAFT_803334 [Hymenopellis radicata]|nr:hypothetical protein BDZ89DRAFT_803334 [Hymenopellis radicata]